MLLKPRIKRLRIIRAANAQRFKGQKTFEPLIMANLTNGLMAGWVDGLMVPDHLRHQIASPERGLGALLGVDVFDRLLDRLNLLRILVRDLNLELVLETNHQVHDVQGICSQIVHE